MSDPFVPTVFERIAAALERIADALERDGVESIATVTPGPFRWVQERGAFINAQEDAQEDAPGADIGRPRNTPSHCGRCGREGRSRRNHKPFCHDCEHEPWWDK